jgi:hypothetical protein
MKDWSWQKRGRRRDRDRGWGWHDLGWQQKGRNRVRDRSRSESQGRSGHRCRYRSMGLKREILRNLNFN